MSIIGKSFIIIKNSSFEDFFVSIKEDVSIGESKNFYFRFGSTMYKNTTLPIQKCGCASKYQEVPSLEFRIIVTKNTDDGGVLIKEFYQFEPFKKYFILISGSDLENLSLKITQIP